MGFDLIKLLTDVFQPEAGEAVVVACDEPGDAAVDTPAWQERRAMAEEWRRAFEALGKGRGFSVYPLLTYRATGGNNAELPATGRLGGSEVVLDDVLMASTLAAFLTQFSATAPLDGYTRRKADFRAASLPGVAKSMERSALAADYREVARRCKILLPIVDGSRAVEVEFSSGHTCVFDTRHRVPEADDGFLPRHKRGDRVINLPSGEVFVAPYEGELHGDPSRTSGSIPVAAGREVCVLRVEGNRIVKVEGSGEEAARLRRVFDADPARANVAEVAFGCNEWARVTGIVLEDEKAGFHWAYGRSEHLGGTVGPSKFTSPQTVLHQDIVYAKGNPIQVARAVVVKGATRTTVMRNGAYVVF